MICLLTNVPGLQHGWPPYFLRASLAHCFPVIFKTHTNQKVRERTIDNLLTFRTYVHYHLMCSKSYIHTRMRTRVEDSLKVRRPLIQSPGSGPGVFSWHVRMDDVTIFWTVHS